MTELPEGSAVVLIDPAGRVLLQQRDDDTPPAGYGRWAIPGGHREAGEEPRATALREFEEETGVRLERLRFFRSFAAGAVPGLNPPTVHLFFADDDVDRAEIGVFEGLDFQYFTPAEAAALPMNPGGRTILDLFLESDQYHGTVAAGASYKQGTCLIALDRWGRALLQLRDADLPPERYPNQWSIPGGHLGPGESPDAALIREFEEETGQLVEDLRLYRVFRRADLPESAVDVQHCYYADPDIDEALIEVNEGQAFRYFGPPEIATLEMPPHARAILSGFFVSPAYKALFH